MNINSKNFQGENTGKYQTQNQNVQKRVTHSSSSFGNLKKCFPCIPLRLLHVDAVHIRFPFLFTGASAIENAGTAWIGYESCAEVLVPDSCNP